MNETIDIVFGHSFSDAFCTFDMHVFQRKVSEIVNIFHFGLRMLRTSWDSPVQPDCKLHLNVVRSLRAMLCSVGRVP